MKKVLLLILFTLFLCGCVNVNKSSYDGIINFALKEEKQIFKNKTSQGYSYYLPIGISVLEDNINNVILKKDNYTLYLYLDMVSYYNKVREEYVVKKDSFYSSLIENGDRFGYLEINLLQNKKYLIEIMYNYAKIEVIVENRDIKEMLAYAMAILTSISYNNTIIDSMIGEDTLNYSEIEFNIFETTTNESNLIQYDENSSSSEKSNDLPDTDMIK